MNTEAPRPPEKAWTRKSADLFSKDNGDQQASESSSAPAPSRVPPNRQPNSNEDRRPLNSNNRPRNANTEHYSSQNKPPFRDNKERRYGGPQQGGDRNKQMYFELFFLLKHYSVLFFAFYESLRLVDPVLKLF